MFRWSRQQPEDSFTSIPGMDPRADFLLGPGLHDFVLGPTVPGSRDALLDTPIPFILVAQSQAVVVFVNTLLPSSTAGVQGQPPVTALAYNRHLNGNFKVGDTITLTATRAFFEKLANPGEDETFRLLRAAAKQIQLCLPLNRRFLRNQNRIFAVLPIENPAVQPPPDGWPDDTVIVGIIDDGIAFANARFRTNDQKSRVQCFWHQDGLPPSPSVHYGSELTKPDIDDLLAANTIAGAIDEDAVYRQAGLVNFAQSGHKSAGFRLAHGTHVLDLAGGADPAAPPTNRPIIAVQLPVAATAEQTGAGLESYVEDAISYIQDRAKALAGNGPPLPVVINFSYGTLAGPHDGTYPLELAVDAAVAANDPVLRVVLPSGNSNLGRGHEEISFDAAGDIINLHWRAQPDDMASSLLQIWMPFGDANPPAASRVFLSITPPDFATSPELAEVSGSGLTLERDGEVVCSAVYSFQPTNTQRGVFNIYLQPTVRQGPTVPANLIKQVASSGVWTISLRNELLQPEDVVNAWIERDGLLYGYPRRGRQSYFDETSYVRFDAEGIVLPDDPFPPDSDVRRAGMINALATGSNPVVVGGFRRKDLVLADYSAGSPITPTRGGVLPLGLTKPDGVSVSDDSLVHFGVLAAGTRSGSTVPQSGTSVAAPQVTKWVANQLAAGLEVMRSDFESFALASEDAIPPPKPPLPPDRGGAGRIDFPDTMQGTRTRYWLP